MKKRVLGLLSVLTATVVVMAACTGGGADAPPAADPTPAPPAAEATPGPGAVLDAPEETAQDVLTILSMSLPVNFVPWGANDSASSEMNKQIYSHLFVLDYNTFEVVPERSLAVEWDQPDASTTNIRIRDNVLFHDGTLLTAHDVAFSLMEGAASPHTEAFLGMISEVVAHDDFNLTVYTEMPFAPIIRHLAHTGSGIVPAALFQELGQDAFADSPVGSGPFRFVNFTLGDHLELAANQDYWGNVPVINTLFYRSIPEGSVRLMEVIAGNADVALAITPVDVSVAEAAAEVTLHRRMNLSANYIGFNVTSPHISNPLVRQAINYAIDTQEIVDVVFMGVGQPLHGPLADIAWGFVPLEPFTTNIDRARELLIEAGYNPNPGEPGGFSTTIWWNIGNTQREQQAEIVQFELARLNIDVEIISMEWAAYLEGTENGEHDMFILGWVAVTGDADYGLFPTFHSSNFGAGGNRTFWSDPELDVLLERGRSETDPTTRMQIYAEAQQIVRDNAPWIFVNQGETLIATSANLQGFVINPAGHHAYAPVWFD
jgi:peptide/nickel transport system substrate-binding protein